MVHGRVQGVFFRDSTRKKACEFNITGWVRNLSNGCVEVFACGTNENLIAFEKWLWQGPAAASVQDVKTEPAGWEEYADFSIQ